MIKITDKSKCCGCTACKTVCPKKCIMMVSDTEGFLYPEVDESVCIDCCLCEKVCPELHDVSGNSPTEFIRAVHKDDEKHLKSASGGAFRAIAEAFIQKGGHVYAACFENMRVIHDEIKGIDDIERFIGSKYVQSDLNDTFTKILKNIKEEERVLFCGTPCQVSGLKQTIGRQSSFLYTCEIICHGVGSPMFFHEYINDKESKKKDKVKNINFRSKEIQGWTPATLSIEYEKKKKSKTLLHNDPYGIAFSRGLIVRPSCFNCNRTNLQRVADVTLGDYWGCKPQDYDEKGVSIILVNTEEGKGLIDSLNALSMTKTKQEIVIKGNPRLLSPLPIPKQRDCFFQDFNKYGMKKVINSYELKGNWKSKVMEKIPYKIRKKIGKG